MTHIKAIISPFLFNLFSAGNDGFQPKYRIMAIQTGIIERQAEKKNHNYCSYCETENRPNTKNIEKDGKKD